MAELLLHQGEFNNLVFGEGTPYVLEEPLDLFAWQGRVADVPIPRGHGSIPMPVYLEADTQVLSFLVWGSSLTEAESRVQALLRAFRPKEGSSVGWMRWRSQERIWRLQARPIRVSAPYGPQEARSNLFRVVVALAQADPRLYSDTERNLRIPVYDPAAAASAGAYDFPTELPLDVDFTDGVGGEQLVLLNGSADAYPVVTVSNADATPITSFTLTNSTTDEDLTVNATITTGQTLTADMGAIVQGRPGPHVAIGSASRYGDWAQPRKPWRLQAGTVNGVRFSVTGPTDEGNVTCRLVWRDAWT